jgi:NAD(P)-dependent dehydrogenase (short-subunit alcohol dehydrogenase family)
VNNPAELLGRLALVTGGGGGLGGAICHSLADAGCHVVAADIRLEQARAIAMEVSARGGCADALLLDVTDPDQACATIESIVRTRERLDILVNCAGVDVTAPIDELSLAQWDRVLSVNLCGPFVLARAALVSMKQQRRGHIVNVVSTAAKRAWPNATAYHASKWGLLGLSHALHVEARSFGVKVTAVIAGGMRTPFILDRFPDTDPGVLQDPRNVAETIRFVLTQPAETVIPEITVIPMRETSWP